ncbi:beta-ketoacyl-ACP reductase [Aliagarivorans taiwanensis]|uniref:beta-ketoacyl-ACP reductase n=1 Tax=Aliagarivorans taiwanensis TaxID=561966 RepID=UPI000420086E|nr:beta-ketoacyl-ACP reductase [Aliagarivorans taiwanensis]
MKRIAIVSGASRGIGRAIAETLIDHGYYVVGMDLEPLSWGSVEQVLSISVDVSDRDRVSEAIAEVRAHFQRIDVLVNNAGLTRDALLENMCDEDWQAVIDVNLKGAFLLTQAVAPQMMEQGYGCVVNIASIVGLDGNIGQSNYAASKGGLVAMSRSWAKEFSRKGAQVRVNCVAPGFIETEMTANLPEKVSEQIKVRTPLKRMGSTDDIAQGVLFLASDKSSFITGQVLKIDGGLVL